MKKESMLIVPLIISTAFSQNLQVHYDFGKDRDYFTTTIEMFKPDEYGATFFFVDMDYNNPGNKSISLSYLEIARYIDLKFINNLSATVQYNDGVAPWGSLGQVWLTGFTYPIDLGFIVLTTEFLFRHEYQSSFPDFQTTFVWFKSFYNDRLSFTGFLDIWSDDKNDKGEKELIFQSEPQIWYNIDKHLAVGGEVEISKNFLPTDNWEFMPTLGVKWKF